MKPQVYWRWSLALPLIFPVVAFCAWWAFRSLGEPPLLLEQILFTVVMSGYLLGAPYAALAAIILFLVWSRPPRSYLRAALLAPIAFAIMLLCAAALYFAVSGGTLSDAVNKNLGIYLLLTLVMGYGYVAVAYLGAWLFTRWGMFDGSA